jgi:predicted nucleic acid-binding protein
MNGIEFLLDTNFILGMLKSMPQVLEAISARKVQVSQYSYSVISRIELLGFPCIQDEEKLLIGEKLKCLAKIELDLRIEEAVISIRQVRKLKLPDAIILGTALVNRLELLTLDKALDAAWRDLAKL